MVSCLVQGYAAKKWQTWALKPGGPAPESTLPTTLPCCLPGEGTLSASSQAEDIYFHLSLPLFLSIVLSIPHSSPQSSLNHPLSNMFPSAPHVRLAWRGDRTDGALGPDLPSSGLDEEMNSPPTGGAGAGVAAPT